MTLSAGAVTALPAAADAPPLLGSHALHTLGGDTRGSNARTPILVNGIRYFVADDGDHGSELYRSTGSGPATLVKDIAPGGLAANPRDLTTDGTLLYFEATDGDSGYELWVTDGTSAGTRALTTLHGPSDSAVTPLGVTDGKLVFVASDAAHGRELWSSDGTVSGTALLKDINTNGTDGSDPRYGVVTDDGTLFFTADDGVHGNELWTTDGTASGTSMVVDLRTGASWSRISYLTAIGNNVYFSGWDDTAGVEGDPFVSDGTAAGTHLIKDFEPTPGYSTSPQGFVAFNGKVYFSAFTQANGTELYSTDGTSAGTQRLLDIRAGSGDGEVGNLTVIGSALYFTATDGTHGKELWTSDGTAPGTHMVSDVNPTGSSDAYNLTSTGGGTMAFSATDGVHGYELWTTDGTTTAQVKDINIDGDAYPSDFVYDGSLLWFQADDGADGTEPWTSDGTAGGTTSHPLNSAADAQVGDSARAGDKLVAAYSNTPLRLLVSDGTSGATSLLSTQLQSAYGLVSFGDKVLFQGDDGTTGSELWITDGTDAGTHIVADVNPGSGEGLSGRLAVLGDKVYFVGRPDNNSGQLWVSDGTAAGTHAVTDDSLLEWPSDLMAFDGRLAFSASDSDGYQAWVSDGTAAGTRAVHVPGVGQPQPHAFGALGHDLYFSGQDDNGDRHLYVTDGTSASTRAVGGDSGTGDTNGFVAAGNKLYFTGNEPDHGLQLYVTDGSAAGTHLVKVIGQGNYYQGPKDLTPVGDKLVFTAGGAAGVWVTDGTTSGTTTLVSAAGEDPAIRRVGSRAYFAAIDDAHGTELWSTDGTVGGTGLAADLVAGANGSHPRVAGEVPGTIVVLGDAPGLGGVAYGVEAPAEPQAPGDGDGDGDGTTTAPATTTPAAPAPPAAPVAPAKPVKTPAPTDTRRAAVGLTLAAANAFDARPPFRYAVIGRLRLPVGVAKAKACAGTVTVTARRGDTVVARATTKLAKDCTYAVTVTKATKKLLAARGGKLTLTARFSGNAVLRPARSKAATVRYGSR